MDFEPDEVYERLLTAIRTKADTLLAGTQYARIPIEDQDRRITQAQTLYVSRDNRHGSLLVAVEYVPEPGSIFHQSYTALMPDGRVHAEDVAEAFTSDEWKVLDDFETEIAGWSHEVSSAAQQSLEAYGDNSLRIARIAELVMPDLVGEGLDPATETALTGLIDCLLVSGADEETIRKKLEKFRETVEEKQQIVQTARERKDVAIIEAVERLAKQVSEPISPEAAYNLNYLLDACLDYQNTITYQ